MKTPLIETTFVVVDLETTGGSPALGCAITEIGAVKICGGETLGEFQSLVNPGIPIPSFITDLTGITDEIVASAPKIDKALPSFLEFCGSHKKTVLIAHHAPFDLSFLKSAAAQLSHPWPKYRVIDTAKIARYVLSREEVINCKLSTLSAFFSVATLPTHRALDDARATVEVFHGIIERMGTFKIYTLEDLLHRGAILSRFPLA